MKFSFVVIAMFCAVGSAYADAVCGDRSMSDVLRLKDWSVVSDGQVSVTYVNLTAPQTKMIDGEIRFADILGRSLGTAELPLDIELGPGKIATNFLSFSGDFERLSTLDHADVVGTACITGVSYVDGSVFRWPSPL